MIDLSTIAVGAAGKAFSDLFVKLVSSTAGAVSDRLQKALARKGSSFEAHLKATFERCTRIKTLLNRDEPTDLLGQYVNLKFKCGDKEYDDYSLVEETRKRKRIIVSGSGGGGKTMFMKYLWISFFESPKGKIPVFVELRRMNDVTIEKLDVFIYHTIVDAQSTLTEEEFKTSIKEGAFVLVLDGFDEILEEKRKLLERQILDLAHNNPELTIVLSGRWDERFHGWQSFSTFHVKPLDQKRVIDLIGKLKYDPIIKKKFIDRIKKDLFKKHQSFLSSPLLATMMLLTFDQFADIPEKVYLFYEQAFDTLFAKHDATKEAFKRKMYTDLSIDVFKRCLSYVCLASYYEQKFELGESELLAFIEKSLKIEGLEIKSGKFLQDVVESVCILQKDGLKFVFVHRSFQEFFAAYCLARVSSKHIDEILIKVARRPTDNLIKMLFDMDQELVESMFILPRLSRLSARLANIPKERFLVEYCTILSSEVRLQSLGNENRGVLEEVSADDAYFISMLGKLYPEIFKPLVKKMDAFHKLDKKILREKVPVGAGASTVLNVIFDVNANRIQIVDPGQEDQKRKPRPKGAEWFKNTGYAQWCRIRADLVISLTATIEVQRKGKANAIDRLLGM